AFVFFRFYTGTRPSEGAALKWGAVDLLAAKASIEWSRTLGEENAPKTQASARTFSLLPNVIDLLKPSARCMQKLKITFSPTSKADL
ncbi:MAG TPA: hypothetical protein VFS84_04690, partial [Candidatus Binatia bacterium]|nr:hypothetical protein [Candidatus Binatia bacterium]